MSKTTGLWAGRLLASIQRRYTSRVRRRPSTTVPSLATPCRQASRALRGMCSCCRTWPVCSCRRCLSAHGDTQHDHMCCCLQGQRPHAHGMQEGQPDGQHPGDLRRSILLRHADPMQQLVLQSLEACRPPAAPLYPSYAVFVCDAVFLCGRAHRRAATARQASLGVQRTDHCLTLLSASAGHCE